MLSGLEALPLTRPSKETHYPIREACHTRCDLITSNLLHCGIACFTKHLLLLHTHWGLMENILGSFLAGLFVVRRSWGDALVYG